MASENQVTFDFRVGPAQQRAGTGAFERPYRSFPLKWRTTAPFFSQKSGEVFRRYSHFEWLRNELRLQHPFVIIPPIPEKDLQGSMEKFVQTAANDTFLDYRGRALRKFLLRTSAHALLSQNAIFIQFLTLDDAQWELAMKQPKVANANAPKYSDPSVAAATNWGTSVSNPITGAAIPPVGPPVQLPSHPQVWEETKLYVTQLEESIKTLKERLETLSKRRRSTGCSLLEFGRTFSNVGEMERNLEQTESALSAAVGTVGRHAQELSQVYTEHADQESKQVVETLMYYSGMCAAVRETLAYVVQAMSTRDKAQANVRELIQARDKLVAKGGQVAADKIGKAETDLASAVEIHRKLAADAARGEAEFREELRKFHREKQYDMKAMLKKFIELQMDYAAKMRRQWESVMPSVEAVRL